MVLSDENPISSKDTTAISLFLQSCETCKYQKIFSKNLSLVQQTANVIEANYRLPNLPKGKYKLLVVGRDAQQNLAGNGYSISFLISDGLGPSTLNVYPNPANNFCNLEFLITNPYSPKLGIIRLYDVHARLINEVNFSPKVGKNEIFIQLKDKAPGLYFYKAFLEWPDNRLEKFDGKIIIK